MFIVKIKESARSGRQTFSSNIRVGCCGFTVEVDR